MSVWEKDLDKWVTRFQKTGYFILKLSSTNILMKPNEEITWFEMSRKKQVVSFNFKKSESLGSLALPFRLR